MLAAFHELGWDVFEITGTPPQRHAAFAKLRRLVRAGTQFQFLYFENSTHPNLFATSLKQGFAPFLDHRIHRFCKKNGIPVGIFYRDVYWRWRQHLGEKKGLWLTLSDAMQRIDLACYRHNRTHFFLPSEKMAPIIGLTRPRDQFSPLPPGAQIKAHPPVAELRLFYVGGLGGHYRLHQLFAACAQVGTPLTVCIHEDAWRSLAGEYQPYLAPSIQIVHASGEALQQYYEQASVGVLAVEPDEYRGFAAPVKLFEYLGNGKPVLVTKGTYAAEIVEQLQGGWVVPYDAAAIAKTLEALDSDEIARTRTNVLAATEQITWTGRAHTIAQVLQNH